MKKLILFIGVCVVALTPTLQAETGVVRWNADAASIINIDGPYYGFYDWSYYDTTSGTKSNWGEGPDPGTATNKQAPPSSTNIICAGILNAGPGGQLNIALTTDVTLGGDKLFDGGTGGTGILLIHANAQNVLFDGAPLTLIGKHGSQLLRVNNAATAEFKNKVLIESTDFWGGTDTTNGVLILTGGSAINADKRLIFHDLVLKKPGTETNKLNVTVSAASGETITINKLRDNETAGLGSTRISIVGTGEVRIGNTSNFSGTIALDNPAIARRLTFTETVNPNFVLVVPKGKIGFAPTAAAQKLYMNQSLIIAARPGDSTPAFNIKGLGTVIVTENLGFTDLAGTGAGIQVGGNTGDKVRLAGNFTFQFNSNAATAVTNAGITVLAGGGLSNEAGRINIMGGINMVASDNNFFTFKKNASDLWEWYPILALGRNSKDTNANSKGIVLSITGTMPFSAFSFDGQGQFTDSTTYLLLGSVDGFQGSVNTTDRFLIDDAWEGKFSFSTKDIDGKTFETLLLTTYSTIPEPATVALLALGLGAVTLLRRKKIS